MKTCYSTGFVRAACLGLLTWGLSGCGGLTKPYPDKTFYALSAAPATLAPPASRPGVVLKIARVQVAPPFDETLFVYRTGPSAYRTDYYRGFVAPPARLLTGELQAWLSQNGPFACVLEGSSAADFGWILETSVSELYGDYTPGRPAQAVIGARFFLVHLGGTRYEVAFQKAYRETERVAGTAPEDLVAAWNKACGRMFAAVTEDLRRVTAAQVTAQP